MTPKVLMVGCGEHALENLIPSLAAIGTIDVAGLCDNDAEALASAAHWFPNAARLNKDILSAADIAPFDAVLVAATPQVHEHVARTALGLSKPVFVEKPPAVFTNQLVEMAALARSNKTISCVGHNLRHSNAAIEFRNAIAAPGFGNPVAMEMRYLASKPRGTRWGLDSPLRSFLLSHANHAIDLMIYQMGPIQQVVAARAWPEQDGGIAITVQFVFSSGAVGNLVATSYAPHFTLSATVISNAGHVATMRGLHEVEVYHDHQMGRRWGSIWRPRTLETGFRFAGYQTEIERFFIAIANDMPTAVHPSFADEVAIYQAMDDIERAIERS